MMALDLRNDWRTVERPKPWRPLVLTLATAFGVAGILFLQQPNVAAAASPPPPPPAATVEAPAPAPPPVAVVVAPPAPEPAASTTSTTSTTAPTHKKKKHAPLSPDEQTRRALLKLQRAQLDRATSTP